MTDNPTTRDNASDTQDLMELMARRIADADRRRAERANRAWNTMNPHERRLFREAAVMGYVLGLRDKPGPNPDPFPRDSAITADVITNCDIGDRSPYTAALCDGTRRRITRTRRWPGEETR